MKTRGAALLYPDRKRCFRCRSFFGFIVLSGLYCSARCARVSEISPDPADWPREHYSILPNSNGVRRAKRVWDTPAEAEAAAKRNGKQAYECGYCLQLHIGTPRPAEGAGNG